MDIKYFKFIKECKIPTRYEDGEIEYAVVKILADSELFIPAHHHSSDAGADLKSSVDSILQPNKVEMIDAGFSTEIPEGYHAKIVARSSMGKEKSLYRILPVLLILHTEAEFVYCY